MTFSDAEAPSPKRIAQAIGIILSGIFLLDLMGVFIRMLSDTYPASELAVFRNMFGLVPGIIVLLLSADWHARGRKIGMRQWKLGFARGLFVTFAQFCYYIALTKLEFATASTLAFAGPMIVVALAVPILGEHVGPWRWAAVLIGFGGILLVMRPGSDVFTWAALLPLGAAAGYATSAVLVRLVDRDVPSALVNCYSSFSAMFGAALLMLILEEPVAIQSWTDMALIAAMGCSGGSGVLCLIISYRLVQPSLLAPFEYTGIAFAFILGWVFFNEAPFARLFPGVLLIVGAGLLIIWRERRAAGSAQ
ncbi:MAG: DMT family transporter [Pseudomonadota bacterium]